MRPVRGYARRVAAAYRGRMARWVWPTAAGVVASATGIAVNLATELKTDPWAWAAVVLLTAVGVLVALLAQPAARSEAAAPPPARGTVHNSVSGTVHGTVVQAHTVGSYRPAEVDRTAASRDGDAAHRVGRDARRDPGA